MISQEKINEIIEATDVVSLASEFIDLKKRGKNYFGLCPFHDDQSPSFSVSQEKKILKCMSCGEGGNPINFLRKIKNISFDQAARELAKRNNIYIDDKDIEVKQDENSRYYKIMDEATAFYQNYLLTSKSGIEALDYLNKRGITKEQIKKFRIGLAPKDKDVLYKYLISKKFNEIDIEDVGLIKNNKEGYYDVFNNRITFPIINDLGKVIAFSARIYYPSDTEQRYVNTTETPIFYKGKSLFNLNNAISDIRKKKYVILAEGQMDVIALDRAGFTNSICSLGTALTPEQVNLIRKYTQNVVILYDSDEAGLKATKKAFDLFKGFKAYHVRLTQGKDPDEYLRSHTNIELAALIKNDAKDKYNFLVDYLFANININDYYLVNDAKKQLFEELRYQKDLILLEKIFTNVASILGVSVPALQNEFQVFINKKNKPEEIKEEKNEELEIKEFEKVFVGLVCLKKQYFDFFYEKIGDDISPYSKNDILANIWIGICHFYSNEDENHTKLVSYLVQEFKCSYIFDEAYYNKVSELLLDENKTKKICEDLLKRFEEDKYKIECENLAISDNRPNEENLELLMQMLKNRREKEKKEK